VNAKNPKNQDVASHSHFIRRRIEADLASGRVKAIKTRFPPEPNGYLHLGHAKSILLNFGLAKEYGGTCNLRFDDTNPEREEQEYVDSIIESVKWLVPEFDGKALYASDYFDFMYQCAEYLVTSGNAYVDSQSAEDMKRNRGDFTRPGVDSPYRSRSPEENLSLLREMREGKHADGAHVLRARISMASPNINMRDPALYRIKRATHHRTGDRWCIYPMYTYAHPIEDAVEKITHSLCTLEFEDQRPFYDWLLNKLAEGGLLQHPLPQQIEFARLQLTHVMLSKRLLIKLVEDKVVDGWDDPRMPTLAGARRRGYTPEGFRRFAERIGVSKENSWIDYSVFEDCMRQHLDEVAQRRFAVLDPLKLVIENYPEDQEELMEAPNHPKKPQMGKRTIPFSRELWIEREDFQEVPEPKYFRLYPGNKVRLRFGYVIECIGYDKVTNIVSAKYLPETKSGTSGADSIQVKGNIHWVSVRHARDAQIRIYDRLFKTEKPEGQYHLNADSLKQLCARLEPSLENADMQAVQFERHGYFISGRGGFSRTVTLRDSWATGTR